MKTVSGTVTSSKPISLSKAAKILSKFASADNGASPAFVAYLKRSSESFNELVHLRKELKGSSANHKAKKNHIRDVSVGTSLGEESFSKEGTNNSLGSEGVGKKKQKKTRNSIEEGRESESKVETDEGKKKESRKRKNKEVTDDSDEHQRSKKKRR